jgi:spore coat protein A, manganese oxidase
MSSRREFIKYSLAVGAGLFLVGRADIDRALALPTASPTAGKAARASKRVLAQIPGGTLAPGSIPKYATPLLIPPVMPKAAKIKVKGGKNKDVDYYEISVRQFAQQILPAGLPSTTVWGYGAVKSASKKGLLLHNAPSLTIEATSDTPVRIKWINDLKDSSGNYLPHLLAVDPTLHWANPPGGTAGRDMRPQPSDPWFSVDRYTGPVPMVTHVHGSAGVGDESDGYAEAWLLPAATNIPAGYATVGTWHDFFKNKAAALGNVAPGTAAWDPGTAVFQYPNTQRASTIWYHDHTLGMTRLNVYAGPAGFFIIRGGPAGDDAVRDSRTGKKATLPGPAPQENDPFPPKKPYYEIPIAVQDRAFNEDGSLFYPDSRAFFDDIDDYIPDTDLSPIWNPEFFGNTIMVNGNTWPFLNVEKRRYRFRFLNGCDARFLKLNFSNISGVEVWQIGNEGGFLAAPVPINTAAPGFTPVGQLLMCPAERADVIVDFTNVPPGNYVLGNVGPDEPYNGSDHEPADPDTTGQVLEFRVGRALSKDKTTPAQFLVLPAITPVPAATVTRQLALLEMMSESYDAPAAAMLGNVDGDPNSGPAPWSSQMWMDPITENPAVGATEVWEFYNATVDAHPMHIHEVLFQVVNRQAIIVDDDQQTFQVESEPVPPEPWENGWKDTVIALPGQVTRVRAQFTTPGQYVWHCHIVEHEDNEMMRPFRIGPVQPGQPGQPAAPPHPRPRPRGGRDHH